MPRGGKRQGSVGTAYPNRTDLQGSAPVAIQTAPGQTYGDRTAQVAAQRAVPVAGQPVPTAPAASLGVPGAVATPAAPQAGGVPFTGLSARPHEPVTAGLKLGAGPGPDSLTGFGSVVNNTAPSDNTVSLLASLASSPTAGSDLRDIASLAMGTRK